MVKAIDGFALDRKIHAAGWNFFVISGDVYLELKIVLLGERNAYLNSVLDDARRSCKIHPIAKGDGPQGRSFALYKTASKYAAQPTFRPYIAKGDPPALTGKTRWPRSQALTTLVLQHTIGFQPGGIL